MKKQLLNSSAGKIYIINSILTIALIGLFLYSNHSSYLKDLNSNYESKIDFIAIEISEHAVFHNNTEILHYFEHTFNDMKVQSLSFYDIQGNYIFNQSRIDDSDIKPSFFDTTIVENNRLRLIRAVGDDEIVGYISMIVSTGNIMTRFSDGRLILLLIFLFLVMAYFLNGYLFNKYISKPVTLIGQTAQKIAESKDYSLQVKPTGSNELKDLASSINDMVGRMHAWQQEKVESSRIIRENEIKYRSLFESAADAIFLMDGERFIDCNKTTMEMFGCARDEIIGQPPYKFSPPTQANGKNSMEMAQEKILAAERNIPQHFEWRHCRLNGQEFDSEVTLNMIKLSGKKYVLALVKDITSRKKYEIALKEIIDCIAIESHDNSVIDRIAASMAKLLKAEYTFVGKITGPNRIKTISFNNNGKVADNFEYALADTPCENVVGKQLCCYPSNVTAVFPNDIMLADMNIEGYIGIPLYDSHRQPIGILAALYQQEIVDDEYAKSILSLFGEVTAVELERQTANQTIKESQQMLELVLNTIPVRVYWKDKESRYLGCNQLFLEDAGLSLNEQIIGKNDYELSWHEKADHYRNNDFNILKTGKPQVNVHELTTLSDNKEHWVSNNKYPLCSTDGDIIGVLGCYIDITEIKNAERVLRDSEQRYRTIFDHSPNGIILHRKGKILYANNEAHRIMECENNSDLIGRQALDFVHPEFKKTTLREMLQLYKSKASSTSNITEKYITVKNNIVDVERTAVNIEYSNKTVSMITFRDITAQLNAQRALAEHQEMLQAIIDNTQAVICVKEPNGRYILVNKQFTQNFNVSKNEVCGGNSFDIFDDSSARIYRMNDQKVLESKQPMTFEEETIQADGLHYYVSVKYPLLNEEGDVYAICDIATDITDRKQQEEEVLKNEKLQSVGLLAGGIAHDFNNFLTGILGSISLVMMDTETGSELHQRLSEAEQATLRARELTQQLLTFSRGGEPVKKTASISQLVKETATFTLRGSNIAFDLQIAKSICSADIDPGQIGQVIQNLIINAKQAMPEGGKITIDLTNEKITQQKQLTLAEGNYVKLVIADQGVGIPKKHLGKIFDPYFSTKQDGNGLGLATCYSIIKKHDGAITVESTIGKGTVFTIYLPASEDEVVVPEKSNSSDYSGPANILVMDDEPFIRDIAERILKKGGFTVSTTPDGAETLKKYQEALLSGNPVDIVLLDLTIPGGMGGKETIEELCKIDPNVTAIVCSGYSNDPVMSDYRKYGFAAMVSKPYRSNDLLTTINHTLKNKRHKTTVST